MKRTRHPPLLLTIDGTTVIRTYSQTVNIEKVVPASTFVYLTTMSSDNQVIGPFQNEYKIF